MSNWFSKHLGIRLDSHTLGNLLKNASPAAALIPGVGPVAAALLAGAGSAGGDMLRGHKVSMGNVLTNAGLGAGASSIMGSMGYGGAANATAAGAGGVPGAVPGATGAVAPGGASAATAATAATPGASVPAAGGGGFMSHLANMSMADKIALGGLVMNGVGGVAGGIAQGKQTDMQNAQYQARIAAMNKFKGGLQAPPQFSPQSPFAGAFPQVSGAPNAMMPSPTSDRWRTALGARGFGHHAFGGA